GVAGGCAGSHGGHEGGGGGDHPPRREDAVCGRERDGAEGDGDHAQGVRRGLLRDERPRVRARPDRRVAERGDQRDGGGGRGRDRDAQTGRRSGRPGGEEGGTDRCVSQDNRRVHRGGARHDRRRDRPARDARDDLPGARDGEGQAHRASVEAPWRGAGMSSFGERLAKLSNRLYDQMRHGDAYTAARGEATAHGFDALRGHKYCLLVTYRRSGDAVPTPVWFGLDAEGKLYVRTET